MEFNFRQERSSDSRDVAEIIKWCFKNEATSRLVAMLKSRKNFIKELSLIAEINGVIAGYILLNPVEIQLEDSSIKTLWLEPVCVHPQFQGKGIGSNMILEAICKARDMGFESIFVTGNYSFYSRFGFKKAEEMGIHSSVSIPSEVFLAMELKKNGLPEYGKLVYPREIFD